MRLPALIAATLSLSAGTCLAQNAPHNAPTMSVTPVAYSLSEDTAQAGLPDGFPDKGSRDLPFEMGQPDGSGFSDAPAAVTKPRGTVRLSAQRSKKAFGVPWQTGVFQ